MHLRLLLAEPLSRRSQHDPEPKDEIMDEWDAGSLQLLCHASQRPIHFFTVGVNRVRL